MDFWGGFERKLQKKIHNGRENSEKKKKYGVAEKLAKKCPDSEPNGIIHNSGQKWDFSKISKPRINLRLLATCWFLKFFDFVKFWCCNGRLKEGTLKKNHFWGNFFSNAHNLGPNRAFWTFSVLSTLFWSLAWWWAQKFLNSDLFCARGGCSKRVPVKPFFLPQKTPLTRPDCT